VAAAAASLLFRLTVQAAEVQVVLKLLHRLQFQEHLP
jgi:hypothetical protein